jgi:twitching motility two-component system response regulator PilG
MLETMQTALCPASDEKTDRGRIDHEHDTDAPHGATGGRDHPDSHAPPREEHKEDHPMQTRYKIRLRRLTGQPPEGSAPEPGAPRPLVMVIDDSPTVRKILETCLSREDYPVISFADGITALRWLREPQAPCPRLIFLDLILPGMPGLSVARALKQLPQAHDATIVMLTRRAGLIDRLQGRLAGADVYLTKPFKTQEILALASQVSQRSADTIREGNDLARFHHEHLSFMR